MLCRLLDHLECGEGQTNRQTETLARDHYTFRLGYAVAFWGRYKSHYNFNPLVELYC